MGMELDANVVRYFFQWIEVFNFHDSGHFTGLHNSVLERACIPGFLLTTTFFVGRGRSNKSFVQEAPCDLRSCWIIAL